MPPKISVVVLTKNSKKYIRQCIESILMQNYPDFEVIVVDAGSEDETIPILNEYKNKTKIPFKIEDVSPDTSIGKARQIGLELSNGEILAFIDSDVELSHENWFKNMSEPLQDGTVAGVQTLAKSKDTDPEILKKIHSSFEYKNTVIDINHYEIVGTSHILIRKDLIEKVGGFRDICSSEDLDVTKKIMKLGFKFIYLPSEKCYHYHVDNYWHYLRKEIRNKKLAIRRLLFERE
ncbi:glycosyltransferase [Candidatus Pacearchaeota archaeon]|nr:glycosyltransferase [Candidatus Pacearchaeota archaeon]